MPSLAVSISYTYPTEPLIDGCSDPNYAISSPLNHQDTLPLNIVDKVIGILATQHSLSSLTANDGESEDDKHWREMKRIMMRFSGRLISLTKDADGET